MSKWQGGPLPFEADAIETIWDERKCIYWIYRLGDKLYCRVRGSKPPYPISEPELIGTGYYGSGSIIEWADGFLNIFWPNNNPKKVMQKYTKAADIPDPSVGPKPPYPVYPTYDEYHIHWIGLLQWMYNHPEWSARELIDMSVSRGASAIQSFGWVGINNAENSYNFEAMPWVLVNGKVDFTQKNPKYEAAYKRLAQMCKNFGVDYKHELFMRYNEEVFRAANNVNGINGFFTSEATAIQKQYIDWTVQWDKEIYGEDYKPMKVLMNEMAHIPGNDESAHEVADWHREIGDHFLQYTDIDRMVIDNSHSDFALSWFVEPTKCPYHMAAHGVDFWFGREEFAGRKVQFEMHGCSTIFGWQDAGYEHVLGSGWKHCTGSEDGAFDGNVWLIRDGSVIHMQADDDEYLETMKYIERTKGGKKVRVTLFMFDPLRAKETEDPKMIIGDGQEHYDKIKEFNWPKVDAFKKVFG